MGPTTRTESEYPHRIWLWFAVFVGPFAWAADSALGVVLTQRACTAQTATFLLVFSAIALGLAFAGLVTALRANRQLRSSARNVGGSRADPSRFLALSAIALSAGFLLAIIAAAIPRFMIDPCV